MMPTVMLSHEPRETFAHGFQTARAFPRSLILLHGTLGAGKTLWAKGFAAGLGLADLVASPSFTILNIYGSGDRVLYHLDLYRIDTLEEVVDIGLFEVLAAGHPCVIEWPERVPHLAALPHLAVHLDPCADDPGLGVTSGDASAMAGEGPVGEAAEAEDRFTRFCETDSLPEPRRIAWTWKEGDHR
jgi:tRNA threonylcarbamoyladenosine biosynthesis protein TsaE